MVRHDHHNGRSCRVRVRQAQPATITHQLIARESTRRSVAAASPRQASPRSVTQRLFADADMRGRLCALYVNIAGG